MSSYKEIVTKAVIGKGKKTTKETYFLTPEYKADTVLGCWIINNSFEGSNDKNHVVVKGSFDVNVWYSYDNDTKTAVSNKRFTYDDEMNIRLKENSDLSRNPEIIVRCLRQPSVVDVEIINNEVKMNVEKELGIEVIGDTIVKVMADDNFDDYDIIEEEITKKDIDEIDKSINENYLN